MNNTQIIEQISKSNRYLSICKRYTQVDAYELYNEFLISIFKTDNEKLIALINSNRFDSHCRNVIYWMATKSNNKLHYTPKKQIKTVSFQDACFVDFATKDDTESKINKELKLKAIQEVIDNEAYWYNKRLYELFTSGMTIHQIKVKTPIHRRNIEPIIKDFIKEVKTKYETLCTQL